MWLVLQLQINEIKFLFYVISYSLYRLSYFCHNLASCEVSAAKRTAWVDHCESSVWRDLSSDKHCQWVTNHGETQPPVLSETRERFHTSSLGHIPKLTVIAIQRGIGKCYGFITLSPLTEKPQVHLRIRPQVGWHGIWERYHCLNQRKTFHSICIINVYII